jgi:hypothetical protein
MIVIDERSERPRQALRPPETIDEDVARSRLDSLNDRKERDDDCVLHDGRKAFGQPIFAPRIDRQRDESIDGAEGNQQRADECHRPHEIGGQEPVPKKYRQERVHAECEERRQQPSPDMTVGARDAQDQRRRKENEPDNRTILRSLAEVHRKLGNLEEAATIYGRLSRLDPQDHELKQKSGFPLTCSCAPVQAWSGGCEIGILGG